MYVQKEESGRLNGGVGAYNHLSRGNPRFESGSSWVGFEKRVSARGPLRGGDLQWSEIAEKGKRGKNNMTLTLTLGELAGPIRVIQVNIRAYRDMREFKVDSGVAQLGRRW